MNIKVLKQLTKYDNLSKKMHFCNQYLKSMLLDLICNCGIGIIGSEIRRFIQIDKLRLGTLVFFKNMINYLEKSNLDKNFVVSSN